MYPRYEYANLDVTSFEQPTPYEPTANYSIMNFDQQPQFLPEIETSGAKYKCRVCNLDSHGMHFGVQTCRPCAAFFRRIVVLDLKYTCVNNSQKCNVDGRGRNVCRDCRYKKCIAVGMTTDNVQYNRDNHNNKNPSRPNNKRNSLTVGSSDVTYANTHLEGAISVGSSSYSIQKIGNYSDKIKNCFEP